MNRFLPALAFVFACAAQAQGSAAEAPVETAGPLAIGAFAALFFGAIGWYVWLTWRKNKAQGRDAPPRA